MRLHIPPKPRDQWNSPITDYDILTEESCKLLLEQSKNYLDETIQESEELTQRSTRMIFLLLPAVAAIIGFIILHREKFKPVDSINFLLIVGACICLINCIWDLFILFSPKNIHYRGAKPEEMMRPEIFQLRNEKQVEKAIYVSEIERTQIKIEQMEFWNYDRIITYSNFITAFLIMMGAGIVLLVRSI